MRVPAIAFLILLNLQPAWGATGPAVSPGKPFPPFTFTGPLPAADRSYLGLPSGEGDVAFTADEIPAEFLVVELFNRFCFGCRVQAPLMNQVHALVAADPLLAPKIRFLGLGVGNSSRDMEIHRREFSIPFPLLPDPRFLIQDAIGDTEGTPYTIVLRRTAGKMVVVHTEYGVMASPKELASVLGSLAVAAPATLPTAGEASHRPAERDVHDPPPAEIASRVRESFRRSGLTAPEVAEFLLPSGERLFTATEGTRRLWVRLLRRSPVCDVCHPVHFLITFDGGGRVTDFDALWVTKYGNEPWTGEEVEFLRRRLVGLSVRERRPFDAATDAVTSATISSSLIFDSVGRTGEILDLLRQPER
jgi:hypothetical protein